MSILDLNKDADFAKLTLSSAAGVLNQLTGAISETWDIDEGAYGHPRLVLQDTSAAFIRFHVFKTSSDYNAAVGQVQDRGGRQKAKFRFPYVDGQTTDDLGRKPETFDIDILLFGANYKRAYKNLIDEFNNPVPGTLIHPVRGRIRCAAEDWTVIHSSEKRQAVALHVTFTEHNFDFSFTDPAPTVKSKLAQAIAFFTKIDNVLTKIQSNLLVAQSIKNAIVAALGTYKTDYAATLARMNATFNNGSSTDLPGLLPNSGNFPSALSPNDPFTSVPDTSGVTSAALAAQQATDEVSSVRTNLNGIISQIQGANAGQGAVIFHSEVKDLKDSALAMQDVLETGLKSSRARIIQYVTPRLMSLREVAFANGVSVDSVDELALLNPTLASTNYIPSGTALQVPVA